MVTWPLFGLCVILFLASMMVPNLDRPHRRQFVNEAVSVAKLRTINRLQARYSQDHPKAGFTCELSQLKSADQAKDPHYDPEQFLVAGTQSARANTYGKTMSPLRLRLARGMIGVTCR